VLGEEAEAGAETGFELIGVKLRRFDQRVHERNEVATVIRAGEGPVFAADGDNLDSVFGHVVRHLAPAICRVALQSL
jgi:hypothetical protein